VFKNLLLAVTQTDVYSYMLGLYKAFSEVANKQSNSLSDICSICFMSYIDFNQRRRNDFNTAGRTFYECRPMH